MAANSDLLAAVHKAKQRLHRRFMSTAGVQDLEDFRKPRKPSPQRIFDLRSEKYRISGSRSRDKQLFGSKDSGPQSALTIELYSGERPKQQTQYSLSKDELTFRDQVNWQDRTSLYEKTISALCSRLRKVKAENSRFRSQAEQIRMLEKRVDQETVGYFEVEKERTPNLGFAPTSRPNRGSSRWGEEVLRCRLGSLTSDRGKTLSTRVRARLASLV